MQRRRRASIVAGVLLLILGPLFALGASPIAGGIATDDETLRVFGYQMGVEAATPAEVRSLLSLLAAVLLGTGAALFLAGIGVLGGWRWGQLLGIVSSLASLWITGYLVVLALSGRTEGGLELVMIGLASVFILYALSRGLWTRVRASAPPPG